MDESASEAAPSVRSFFGSVRVLFRRAGIFDAFGRVGLPAILGLSALTIAGAGCKVGPEYVPPEPKREAPPELSSTETSAAKFAGVTTKPITPDWWNTLKDDKLTALVRRSVESNLDLRIADARVREARAVRGIAFSNLGPQVGFGGGYTRAGDYSVASGNWNFGFDAAWEIDVFGGNRRAVEAAEADAAAAEESRRDVLVSLLGEVARNYVELRAAQRQLAIARQNIELAAKNLEIVRGQKENGLRSDLEVRQAAGLVETVKATVPRLEAALRKAAFRLSVLQGREPSALLSELSEPGPIPPTPPELPVGLPSELLRRRPDLRRAEREMAAATARLGVAQSDLLPKFALTANVSIDGFYAGPAIKWPVFDTGRILSNIKATDARLEQATLRYRASVLAALEDVEGSLTSYAQEQIRHINLAAAVAEAEEAVRRAEDQYKTGTKDFLVVLDAQRTLFTARDELVRSEQASLTFLISVYKALGGGWDQFEPLPVPPPPAAAK
jgi:NodT family efflux transporter outer membrane factor (OMF) lipoprotein